MRNFYKILLFILLLLNTTANAKITLDSIVSSKKEHKTNGNDRLEKLLTISATITGGATVCQNATGVVVTFTGSGGTAPYTFMYNIDGVANIVTGPMTGNTISLTMPTGTPGTFIYNLVSVKDNTNATQTLTSSTTFTISAPPTVDFTFINDNSCSGTSIQFTSSVSGGGASTYSWDFGDSTALSTEANPAHTFTSFGCGTATFTVTLSVTKGGCKVTKSKIISVLRKPDISFEDKANPFDPFSNCSNASSNPVYSINVGNTSASTCISSFSINWGDGNTQSNISFPISHTYSLIGAYSMVITAVGNNGCSNTKTYIIKNVSNPLGGINSPGSTQNLCAPTANLQFSISNWGSNSLDTTYSINYGDNTPLLVLTQAQMNNSAYYIASNPSNSINYPIPHIYTTSSCPATSFVVTLDVTNACGTTPFTLGNISILRKPTANFSAPINSCVNSNIIFTNTTIAGYGQGCVQSSIYTWNFGDGTPTITTPLTPPQNINHTFATPGIYTVTLTSQNFCGTTTKTQQICIEPPLTPLFSLNTTSACAPVAITATNTTSLTNLCSPATYIWKVTYMPLYCAINAISIPNQTTANASYNFTESGTYTITLTATNSCGSVTSASQTVIVKQPPTVTLNPIASLCQILPNTTISPTANVTNCGTQSLSYEWSFPGGNPATSTDVNPSVSYSTSGNFSYSLKVTNECGANTANSSFTINPSPTITGTLFSCIGLTSQLTGSTTAAGTNTWGSSPQTIATITATGLVRGISAGMATITYTNSLGCRTTEIFTVNLSPTVTFSIPNQTICSGETSALVTLSSVAGATLKWTSIQPVGLSAVITDGNNTIPPQTLINNTNADIIVTYNATSIVSSGATCAGAVFPYIITVKPKPVIATNMSALICSGLPFSVSPTNGSGNLIPTGTTYSWVSPAVPIGLSGGTLGTDQTTITGTLTNATNIVQTATYTVIPSFNGCAGLPFDVVVSVNPKPDLNNTADVVLCAGETSTLINFSGNISGATYTWSSNVTSISIAPSGSDTIPSFTAINTGVTPIIATITVTPSANGCPGLPKTFKITVNPKPNVNSITNLVKCNGNTSGTILFTESVTGTTFDWTNDTPSIGLAGNGNGNISSFIATNPGLTPIIATITITPKANGCLGAPTTFTITVNPAPTVDLISNQTVCNGQQTNAIVFSGAIPNTIFNWTNTNPTIGLGDNGVGDIPAFTAINNGTTPIVANITVTPTVNGCPGTPRTFSITINPSPAVTFTPSNQTICSGDTSALVTLSSISGTTFKWDATISTGITSVATTGTNTIPAQTLINTTNLPIIITYNATAESTSGISCQGITYPYTITVNPVPSITSSQAQTVCSNTAFSIIPFNGSGNIVPAGTTYSWLAPVISSGISGDAALSDQTSIIGTLINTTDSVQTATYTVTPKSGSCIGSPFTIVITLNPSPKVIFSGANQTLCSSNDSLPIALTSPTTENVTFSWTATIPTGISEGAASGMGSIPTQTLVNTSTTPLTVIYTATATFENNGVICSGRPFDYKITVNPAIVTSSISKLYNGFNVSAVGATDGSIDITVTGGSSVYTYLWSGPNGFSATGQDISNVAAGAYSLTINDGLCSPIVLNFTLTSPLPLIIEEDLAAHTNLLCFGYSTGVIKVDITQQSVGPYDYILTLQGGGTITSITNSTTATYTFSSLAAGNYDVKVTDANGSVKTILGIIITQPSGITASTTQTNISCAGSATGSATVTASGGNGTLTYSWNTIPVQTLATAIGLIAGTYTVTITDANSCSIPKQVIITEPNAIVTSIASQTNVLCFGDNIGSATILATGGTGILSYSWDTIPIQTTATATKLAAGTYILTATDANGCQKNQTVIITQPSGVLSSSISSSTNVSCFGGNDVAATATVVGGTAPYSYSWNTIPAQTLATATGLKAGNYTVLISDSNTCSTSTTVTITEPAGMTATITAQTDVFCSGNSTGSATVTATGGTLPYIYSWNTSPIQTSDVAVNLADGSYTVTITDAKGCIATTQATITEPNGIVTAIASQTNVNCFGNNTGAITISASGGAGTLSYSWDTIPIQTTPSLSGLIAGTYNLTVTDANNCTKVQTVTMTEPDDILITTVLEKDITCFNNADGAIDITISGGTLNYTLSWTKDGTDFANTEDISNLSPGIYVIIVSDANNCSPKTATFTITQPPILAVTLINQTNILCFGDATGAINVSVTGGTTVISDYKFTWTGPNGFSSPTQNLTTLFAGTYNLIVQDNSGCFKNLAVTLMQPTAINITVTTTPITCYDANDASITLNVTGGTSPYLAKWDNLATGLYQNNLAAGDYIITVTDGNNCEKVITVNIPQAPLFKVTPIVKNISCFGANDGSINLNLVGGIPTVALTWSDGSTAGTTRNNLSPGIYTAVISDGTPCYIRRTFTILEPQPLVLSANTKNAFDCNDANSGAINLLVSGGSAPFTYTWSNGATTEDLVNITAGNYLVTVTDKNGCAEQAQYSINRPPPIVTKVITKTAFDCAAKTVKQTFKADVSGGKPPYQLAWSSGTVSGANNEFMDTTKNGTVQLEATDALGCKFNYTFTVDVPELGTPIFNTGSYAYTAYGSYSINDPIQFTNAATGDFISMIWDFGDGTTSIEIDPLHTFVNSKDYVITQTVTYPYRCVYVKKITINIEKGYVLVVPTAFTPNSDSINDTLKPVTKGLKNIRLDIYDTWGAMIYSEKGDVIKGWDGKIKNANAENGNYYSKVSGETFYGTTVNENSPFILIK